MSASPTATDHPTKICNHCRQRPARVGRTGGFLWCQPCSSEYRVQRTTMTDEQRVEANAERKRVAAEARDRRTRDHAAAKERRHAKVARRDALETGDALARLEDMDADVARTFQPSARISPGKRMQMARQEKLAATNDLHVIADIRFPHGREDQPMRYLVCACGWSVQDAKSNEEQGDRWNRHRDEMKWGKRRPRSGPVERIFPDEDAVA